MEFLIALQSTEDGDCADAELANTKSDIKRIRMGCPRSEPRSRLGAISRSIRGGHPNPLLSVTLRRTSQLESSIAALASMSESGQIGGGDFPSACPVHPRKQTSPGRSACTPHLHFQVHGASTRFCL